VALGRGQGHLARQSRELAGNVITSLSGVRLMKLVLAAALIAAVTIPALAATAPKVGPKVGPKVSIATLDEVARPLPLPYDETANGAKAVAAAKARAKASGKLLLIDLGGNWCPDCRVLAGVFGVPEVKAFMDRHYEVVTVDIGRRDKNLGIAESYGADIKGVPAVLIVEPRTNKLKNPGRFAALSDARNMTPQALADWLASWV